MGNLDLAAASLGAAAPVPPAQDTQSKCAAGFADVLAGCTPGAPDDAAGADATHARSSKGQPAWVALEQLARQLALSSGLAASALPDPKRARVTSHAPVADAGPADAGEQRATSAIVDAAAVWPATLAPPTPALRVDAGALLSPTTEDNGQGDVGIEGSQTALSAGQTAASVETAAVPVDDEPFAADTAQTPAAIADGGATIQTEELKSPEVVARVHRPDVEAFRDWAVSVARTQAATVRPLAATPRATASLGRDGQTIPATPQAGDAVNAASVALPPVADEVEKTAERGSRAVRRTPEAAKALVERFKANEMPLEAAPVSVRLGPRPADAAQATTGAEPYPGLAPSPRFEIPVVQTSMPSSSRATTIGAEPSAMLDQDGAIETQIVQALKVQWGHDGGEARIRLQPHYLGELTIQLRVEHGTVTAHLVASSPDVRQWIESNEALLRQSLAQHDLELERLVVVEEEPASSTSDQQPADQEPRGQARRQNRPHDRDATFEVVV